MNILYGIQGTGHGHISRAREILPALSSKANIDVLISGYNCNMQLDDLPVINKRGMSLAYDSNGGVSYLQTALQIQPVQFLSDVHTLDIGRYDLIISDYEPISSWAAMKAGKACVGLSHQASFLSNRTPRPRKKSILNEQILKRFAPCHHPIGFHFLRYDRFIEGPVIRRQVQQLNPVSGDHITVYLPAFDHETIASIFMNYSDVKWEIFSPLCDQSYTKENVTVHPVGNEPFLKSLESCFGVITSAGFETCAEAIYLGKKLMVIPIRQQYEQLSNAAALKKMGVTVVSNFGDTFNSTLRNWLQAENHVTLPEIADIEHITKKLLRFARQMAIA